MGSFLLRENFNLNANMGKHYNGTESAHRCYNLLNNCIAHNLFFLFLNLEIEKKKYREKLSTKLRSKILEDHFPCNGSIFHNVDALPVQACISFLY